MASITDQVETIILVMMENRSFDHMLGHLSIDTPSMQVNGLRGNLDQYENDYQGTIYPCWERGQDDELSFDLPHEYSDVQTQFRKNPVSGNFSMRGFVEAFANSIQVPPNTEADPMGYFPARLTTITDFLARNFCICDNWFAPIPTSTQPNRTMAFSGDSSIYQTKAQLISIQNDIFRWMEANKIRWRVYHDGFSFFSLYNSLWPFVFGEQFRRTEFLYPDILHEPTGQAPQVIIIEPSYEDAPHLGSKHPNDNHAPLAVGWGEDFLRRTYQAVTANPDKWAHTVMVVYYDEHGGFYDHVPPPAIGYTTTGSDAHVFESLGPRIPGLIISPLVKPGSICSKLFDHTSVLQFIAERFTNGTIYSPTVSKRKAAGIQSISVALNNSLPFVAPAAPTVAINSPAKLGKSLTQAPSTEMGKSFELAALQMLEQKPAEVARKYPELIQWKDTAAKSGVGEDLMRATSQPVIPTLSEAADFKSKTTVQPSIPILSEAAELKIKTTVQPSYQVMKSGSEGLVPATSQPAIPPLAEAAAVPEVTAQPSDRVVKSGSEGLTPATSQHVIPTLAEEAVIPEAKSTVQPSDPVVKGHSAISKSALPTAKKAIPTSSRVTKGGAELGVPVASNTKTPAIPSDQVAKGGGGEKKEKGEKEIVSSRPAQLKIIEHVILLSLSNRLRYQKLRPFYFI